MEPSYADIYAVPLLFAAHRNQTGKKTPLITVSQVRVLLNAVLPLKQFFVGEMIELIRRNRIRNRRAYLSHRNKKQRFLF